MIERPDSLVQPSASHELDFSPFALELYSLAVFAPLLLFRSEGTVTQQHGFIKFDSQRVDSITRLPQYIRLALKTPAEDVVEFMRKGWGLATPHLIISVTGGAKNFEMSPRLRKIFQQGLIDAAVTTSNLSHILLNGSHERHYSFQIHGSLPLEYMQEWSKK